MTSIQWSHGWGLFGQILVILSISSLIASPLIGSWLHNRRTNQQFNQTLVGAAARARKAKIDQWLSDEEEAYLKRIQAHYGSAAEAATRDEQGALEPDYAYRARVGLDKDEIPFSNDYADQQPHRPQPPQAA